MACEKQTVLVSKGSLKQHGQENKHTFIQRRSQAVSMVSSFVFPKWRLKYETRPAGEQGALPCCRWVSNIEMFEVSRGVHSACLGVAIQQNQR